MEVQVTITSEELEAIKAYADFMRDNDEPCDRKCGPPGSPDRRACCGCPEHVTNQYGNFRVLNSEQIERIYELHKLGYIDKMIAKEIGCSRELVGRKIREAGLR